MVLQVSSGGFNSDNKYIGEPMVQQRCNSILITMRNLTPHWNTQFSHTIIKFLLCCYLTFCIIDSLTVGIRGVAFYCEIFVENIEYHLKCDRLPQCILEIETNVDNTLTEDEYSPQPIHLLSDNCNRPVNRFFKDELVNKTIFSHYNGKYRVLSDKITSLHIHKFFNFTFFHFPYHYFCSLSSLEKLTFEMLAVQYITWPIQPMQCCSINLKHIIIKMTSIKNVKNHTFCSFPKLETLITDNECETKKIKIENIEENAFASLTHLQELSLPCNGLAHIHQRVFAPLVSLSKLNLGHNNLTQAVLSALTYLPKLRVLILNDNNIIEIDAGPFCSENSLLIELDLSNNLLSHIVNGTFRCLKKIKILNLSGNKFYCIDSDFFNAMHNLMEIKMVNCNLVSLPDGILKRNSKVKIADFSCNPIRFLPRFNSVSLEVLNLSHNALQLSTEREMKNVCELTNLKVLDLSGNHITRNEGGTFQCITNNSELQDEIKIHYLYLQDNSLESFECQHFSKSLLELNLFSNEIDNFHCFLNSFVLQMALKNLDLSYNSLRNMTSTILPPKLEFLILSNNKINSFSFPRIPSTGEYQIPSNLTVIDLRSNYLTVICPLLAIPFNIDLKVNIQLENNRLLCVCEVNIIQNKYYANFADSQDGFCLGIGEVELNNKTEIATASQTSRKQQLACYNSLKLPCQCNTFSLYSSKCNLPCPANCTCYVNHDFHSYFVNCSDHNLHQIPKLPEELQMPLVLEMSKNHLHSLISTAFLSFSFTTELYLQNNRLRKIMQDTFKMLDKLEVLNLQDNCLEELPRGVFLNLMKLIELNLVNNHFKQIPQEIFDFLTSQSIVQSNYNHRINFRKVTSRYLPALSYVRLGGNPWTCTCSLLEEILVKNSGFSKVVKDPDETTCSSKNVAKPLSFVSYLHNNCSEKGNKSDLTLLLASIMAVMAFLVIIVALILIFRHELQVILYSKTGVRFYHQKTDIVINKAFDAFIAYSSDDAEWVAHQLVPGLEHIEQPYKLCIHEREFLAGALITDSIQEAIERSLRTIVVLSKNFVSSQWCTFEFKTAHRQMTVDGNCRLIVILLGDPPVGISAEMKHYLRTRTYLKWGERLFWQKLYFAMPNSRINDSIS